MSDNTGLETLHAENPFIMGSAVYIVAELKGTQYLFMQIKGNAAGKDEIHSAAAAGGISMKEFNGASSIGAMFQQAALRQLMEEIGLPLALDQLGSPSLFRRENATGNAGIGYIVRSLSGEEVLEAYTKHVQKRLISSSDDTARGLVLIPTDGIGHVSFESANPQLMDRLEFRVTKNEAGLIVPDTPRGLRPAAQGFLSALSDAEFQQFVVHG